MRVRLLLAVFVAVLLAPIADAKEKIEFMSVSEVRQLLAKGPVQATFNTVAEGSTLIEYEVQIKGIKNLEVIDVVMFTSANDIVGGMSGSPVYVKGLDGRRKVLGAVAYGFAAFEVGPHWGGISPIEYMHAEAQGALRPTPQTAAAASFTYQNMTFVPISLQPAAGSAIATAAAHPWVLAPGMPITVDLFEWTNEAGISKTSGATGTITYIGENGDIYAFGHPFLGARTARYNFRTCRILGTLYSQMSSFKMSGDESAVLGTIEYDGAYGIYGKIGGAEQRPVTAFTADFRSNGKPTGTYRVKMATSPFTALIMGMAFGVIGEETKAPFAAQPSTVAFSSTVELEGHEPVQFSQVFTSTQFQFGPRIIRKSSYDNATEMFLESIYVPLSTHRLGFKIAGTHLKFDFTDGIAPSFKVASAQFPSKLKWGEDAFLDLLLVTADNTATMRRRVKIPLDWSKIEKPTYTAETKDTDKTQEKTIGGTVVLYTAEKYDIFLGDNEKEVENPLYFLDAKDFLVQLRSKLGRSNRMLYVRAAAQKISGQLEAVSPTAAVSPEGPVIDAGTPWVLENTGLTERKVTVRHENVIWFSVPLPPVPTGYMVGTLNTAITLQFEIVN